jgi:plastocyanin
MLTAIVRTVALASLAAALAASTAGATTPIATLNGTVGANDGFTISLKKSGTRVTKLRHGTYTVKVRDLSTIHNFHLKGPGVSKATTIEGKQTRTWTVTLRKGTYKYVCDAHVSSMHGSFVVT